MGKILAIRGDKERGNEVIALLEMLGGDNSDTQCQGIEVDFYYYIDTYGCINYSDCLIEDEAEFFTLDEFYKNCPYKVGDRVLIPEYESEVRINRMVWDGWDVEYMVYRNDDEEWYTATELKNWNDDFYDVETKVESTGFMQLGKTFAVIFNDANYEDEVELQLGDYEIEVRNGKTYAVKKKPVYPNTYEECYDEDNIELHFIYVDKNERDLYESLIQLIRCRNAYWKIAGEQMGLGKPWEPNWTTFEGMPAIFRFRYNIVCDSIKDYHCLLVFPTKEMRDAFYENFKDLIEECKEFL